MYLSSLILSYMLRCFCSWLLLPVDAEFTARSLTVSREACLHWELLFHWLCTYSQCVSTTDVWVTWSESYQSVRILNLRFGKYFRNYYFFVKSKTVNSTKSHRHTNNLSSKHFFFGKYRTKWEVERHKKTTKRNGSDVQRRPMKTHTTHSQVR